MTEPDSTRPRIEPPLEPLIGHRAERCVECWGCVRHCPARALKIVDGRSAVIEERCVKCGLCVTECGNAGHVIRDDTALVRELLAGPLPVIALLATESVAAMHPLTSSGVEQALDGLGFAGVETTVLGEELVAAAYELVHTRAEDLLPRLRSTCPVAVEWVKRFHPELTGALVPLVPPYIAQARLVREMYPFEVAVVYVSPCWARKDEVFSAEFAGEVDVAIGFDELRRLIAECPPRRPASGHRRRPQAVKQLSGIDGFPRRTLADTDRTASEFVSVRGLLDLDRLLTAIVRGEAAPAVVDMLSCEGCIDGPCVNAELSVFAKRNVDASERERQPPPAVDSRTFLSAMPPVDLARSFLPAPAPTREPTAEEIDAVLAAGEFASRADAIDCGACGFDTCVEHAASISLGNSAWEMCFPLQRKRLLRETERLSEALVIDTLTGLMNRRAFDERLAEEVARARRYGTPLSLLMIDLDGFKAVNDRHGHNGGDALLRAVGVLLRSELRETDIAVRYGGDEFALVLPGTPKTDAWAVAEKVRATLRVLAADAGDGHQVGTTVSIGVASHNSERTTARALVEAADAALYRAKESGRDRVELSAG